MAKYYHHETVQVDGQNNNISKNVRKKLHITKAKKYNARKLITSFDTLGLNCDKLKSQNTNIAGQKRSSSYTDISILPTNKRTCLSVLTEYRDNLMKWDFVPCCVILEDYKKLLYKASSKVAIFAVLKSCIKGYKSLNTWAGMLQADILIGNFMINKKNNNFFWQAFIINLNLAIKENQNQFLRAQNKTNT